MGKIRVLSPVGVAAAEAFTVPALPREWSGLTVGFLDNTKANFDRLTAEMGDRLRASHGVARIVHRRKANASTPAPAELIADMAKECDVVFAGSAD
jgi:hypothetical protein